MYKEKLQYLQILIFHH